MTRQRREGSLKGVEVESSGRQGLGKVNDDMKKRMESVAAYSDSLARKREYKSVSTNPRIFNGLEGQYLTHGFRLAAQWTAERRVIIGLVVEPR